MPGIDISFCWALGDPDPLDGLAFLRDCGFEGIELWPDSLDLHGPAAWGQALRNSGMRAFQLCPYFNFMEGPAKLPQAASSSTASLPRAHMDCRRLRVFTGPPWGDGVVGAKDATATQWADATNGLREYCDIAARHSIELCLECHVGSLMEDSPNALRLLQWGRPSKPDSKPSVPFDGETWQQSVAALGSYTNHIHIHNWTEGLGQGELTNLADGAFDWEPMVTELVVGMNRHVTLSVEHANHSKGDDPRETAIVTAHISTRCAAACFQNLHSIDNQGDTMSDLKLYESPPTSRRDGPARKTRTEHAERPAPLPWAQGTAVRPAAGRRNAGYGARRWAWTIRRIWITIESARPATCAE